MSITKKQEIEILREAADKLGNSSYMGPWLRDNLDYIEQAITCDVYPRSVQSADKAAQRIKEAAKLEAQLITDAATKDAQRIIDKAKAEAERMSERSYAAIRSTMKTLESIL